MQDVSFATLVIHTDNVYDVTVQVSDGSLTDTQDLTITVTDAFEGRVVDAPIAGATVSQWRQ